jgi:ABC-type uncharacterized transport system involved in gliding motility auxiliary subunit
VDLTGAEAEIPADLDALLVAGPKTPLSDDEKRKIDQFIMAGKSVAFLLDNVGVDLSTAQTTPKDHGLGTMLEAYGVKVKPGLVVDSKCATLNVAQQRGFMRIMQPVRYPFLPQVRNLDREHPLARGLEEVLLPFVSPLEVVGDESGGTQRVIVARSSKEAGVDTVMEVNPLQDWGTKQIEKQEDIPLAVTVSGPLKSFLGETAAVPETDAARVLVIGGSSLLDDQFMGGANEAFVLNMVDWLLLDQELLDMRTRGLAMSPLEEVSDAKWSLLKWGNVAGLPALFALVGVVRWRTREARRTKVSV